MKTLIIFKFLTQLKTAYIRHITKVTTERDKFLRLKPGRDEGETMSNLAVFLNYRK